MTFQCVFAGAVAVVFASAAVGQPLPSVYGGYEADPAARLSANLVALSQNPRDVNALIGAGQSAVAVGDGNAALAFLARAEEIAPRNGRIKAALGSALLLLERPGEALKLFSEASALGIPDSDIAADRGLAHDLKGENRKAQRDYLLAQRIEPSDELTRRLALSYGISGDRSNALSMLDPLLRKQDQAAWRARAFILAMTGDLDDAEEIARTVMPAGIGNGMRPFLRRLATLSPADRAMAVNFGTMPGDGTRIAANTAVGTSAAVGSALIPAGDGFSARVEDRPAPEVKLVVSRDPRRRPGAADLATVRPSAPAVPAFSTLPPNLPPAALVRPAQPPVSADRNSTSPIPTPTPSEVGIVALATRPITDAANGSTLNEPRLGSSVQVERGPSPVVSPIPEPKMSSTPVPAAVFEVPMAPSQPEVTSLATPKPLQTAPDIANTGPFTIGGGTSGEVSVAAKIEPAQSAKATLPIAPEPKPGFSDVPGPNRDVSSIIVGIAPAAVAPAPVVAVLGVGEPQSSQIDPGTQAIASFASAAPLAVASSLPVISKEPAPAGLADIIASIEPEAETAAAPLPTAAELRAARIAQQKKLAAQAKAEADAKAEKDAKEAARKEAARHPARIWVQVATGSNEAGLPTTWKRIRDKSPALFKGMSAASVPFKATNRLLVGPFKSQAEARTLVNAMQKSGMAGSTFASEAGQEIARIAGK